MFYKNKKLLIILFISLLAIFVVVIYLMKNNIPMIIGMHDPAGIFAKEPIVTLSSDYFAWNKDLSVISSELKRATDQNRSFLVTIEPWPVPIGSKYDSSDELLKQFTEGKYDQITIELCDILSAAKFPIYIRWGHEMELTNSRYPWSKGTPELYIEAYKNFVDICRTKSNTFKFVWSPAGEIGLGSYWPGDAYVDLIGLSVYSYDKYEQKYFSKRRNFKDVFFPIHERVKNYNKPILIAEMGVTGNDEYQLNWLLDMKKNLYEYENVVGFVYLNTMDPLAIWEEGLGNPDWRISQFTMDRLLPNP